MSGGGNGSTTTTQTQSLPPGLQDAAQGYLGAAGQVSQLPYVPYTGQRVADLSPLQRQSIQNIADLAGGTGSTGAAEDMLTRTLNGGYSNPYASQGVQSGGQYQFSPLYGGSQYGFSPLYGGGQFDPSQISSGGAFSPSSVTPGSNAYIGDSPYFQSTLDKGLNDITRAYRNGTAAQTDSAFANSHAFGGSAYQETVANNERQLGDTLQNYVNNARQGQYDRSANLTESALARGLNAQQFNDTMGNQAFESAAQRGLQAGQLNNQFGQSAFENAANRNLNAGQFNANLGNQAFESAANRNLNAGQFNANLGNQSFEAAQNRGLQAGQFNANLGSNAYEQERARQVGAVGGAGSLYSNLLQGQNTALNAGNVERGQQQDLLSSLYNDFLDQRGYPEHQLGVFGNALSPLFGGAPRSSTTEAGLPPNDRVSQGLGMMALANYFGRSGSSGASK